ncbi:MAG: septation protein SpoVG family protein [Planctomycetota bacterium]|jgi:stage V sporulation protein G
MQISEVRVKMVGDSKDRLKAYCSITIDECFVIRDLKIIDGTSGLFVAMPSRKLAARCPSCGGKNHLRARHCNDCGSKLDEQRGPSGPSNRDKLHADIAHPINAECRQFIQSRVIEEYEAELKRSQDPDYRGSGYDEDYNEEVSPYAEIVRELKSEVSGSEPSGQEVAEVNAPTQSTEERRRDSTEIAEPGSSETGGEGGFGAGIL